MKTRYSKNENKMTYLL